MKTLNLRAGLIAALALLFATDLLAQDRVVMKNGDVITGNVSLIDGDDVYIEPSYADEFAVDLAEVESIVLEQSFEVELADGTMIDAASLGVNEAGEQVIIVGEEQRPVVLTEIAEAQEPDEYFEWGALVDVNATINDGNSDSRNVIIYGQGDVKVGDHRHYADLTLRSEEQNGVDTTDQTLLNYSYNWFFNDPWFIGGAATYERDPIRDLENRYTAGFLVGRDLIDTASTFLTFSFGPGYSSEEIGGVKEDGAVFLWSLRYEQDYTGWMTFFHNNNLTQQFYGQDNLIIKTNTGFRFDLVGDLYANISLRYDYETEPAPGRSKDDSTLQMGVGYSF